MSRAAAFLGGILSPMHVKEYQHFPSPPKEKGENPGVQVLVIPFNIPTGR